jgi:penicillin-binding protein 1A
MTDSERDINTPDGPPGDLATSTPPEGAPAVPPAPGPDAHDARSNGAHPHPDEADANAHHAFGADAAPEPEPARRTPLRIRRPRKPAPVATPEPDFGEDGYAPVIPLDRASLLAPEPARMRVRIRKLRVFGVLIGLGLLAVVSTVFGMMMAITSDLPELEVQAGRNSVLVDRNGEPLGLLTGNQKRIFLKSEEIAPVMKQAIIAIEDSRFYTNAGIDLRGIGRALYQDILAQQAVQGGSTITMQFVKNALAAEDERTLFQKLREAALAYEITRKWSKERILRNYLNTIYFGNGAYGIEAAARTYFGANHPGCGEDGKPKCAQVLSPAEAALIAGLVASPSGYDPLAHREAAGRRRAIVLQRMVGQGYITAQQRDEALLTSLPTSKDIRPPEEDTRYPYFTSWVKQQVVDKLGGGQEGARKAFEGGLTVQTTLDVRLQEAAEQAVQTWLPFESGPRASLVAIDNRTGEVLAMVGGDDYATKPFNLATQGQRQPGSAFKPFILAQALSDGISPDSTWASRKIDICTARTKNGKCLDYFDVNNYEDAYAGARSLRSATTFSDNSVYAQVGAKVGTGRVARMARRLGIRTPVSHNFAMTLGGLKEGVTPLDMAHAYETFARGGRFTYGTMSPGYVDRKKLGVPVPGPVGIHKIGRPDDGKLKPVTLPDGQKAENRPVDWPVLKSSVASDISSILSSVVTQGTAVRAQIPDTFAAGKTGTTENYGDAWFVGWTRELTVAVWVGYPDGLRPMETEFNGAPVAGGTYPAAIWKAFVEKARTYEEYGKPDEEDDEEPVPVSPDAPATPATPVPTAPTPAPQDTAPTGERGGTEPEPAPAPDTAEPDAAPPDTAAPATGEQPAPAEQQPPADDGGAAAG